MDEPSFQPNQTDIVARLKSLIAVPSVTGDSEKERQAAELVAEWMRECQADEVHVQSVPMNELKSDPSFPGIEVERDVATFAYGIVRGEEKGPAVLLLGHIDVVPVGDASQWDTDPFAVQEKDDKIFGRGACDMKSGVCAAFSVLEHFARHRQFPGSVALLVVSGEEDGGSGCLAAVRKGCDADVCYIPEPTVPNSGGDPTIVVACGGSLTLSVKVEGKSAHASSREEGVNALDHIFPILEGFRESERQINESEENPIMKSIGNIPYATSVGKIQGGQWASSVMDELTMEVRAGVSLEESVTEALNRIRTTVLQKCQEDPWLVKHPPQITSFGGEFAGCSIDPEHKIVKALSRSHSMVYGKEPVKRGTPYGCDMRILAHELGTATCVYGPGSIAQAHAANEFVYVQQIFDVAKVLQLSVSDVLRSGVDVVRNPPKG